MHSVIPVDILLHCVFALLLDVVVLMECVQRNILLSNNCAKLSSTKLLLWLVYTVCSQKIPFCFLA